MSLINSILLQVNTTVAVDKIQEKETFLQLAMNGGWVMVVLLCLLALAIYISIERFLALNHALKEDSTHFMNNIREYVHNGDIDGAKNLAKATDTAIGRMVSKGLSRLGRPLGDIQTAVENEGKMEVAKLEKRVSLVATVASLGPMLGFLGTVIGMVMAFDQIQIVGDIGPTVVAQGMKVALITTIFGIVVALILQLFYSYILSKIERLTAQMEEAAITLLDLISEYKSEEGGR